MTAFSSICSGRGSSDQDTVYGGVVGQLLHLGQQGLLRSIGGQIDAAALDAALGTIVDLAAHIHLAGGVFAHQNDRQAGVDALGFQCGDLLGGLWPWWRRPMPYRQ